MRVLLYACLAVAACLGLWLIVPTRDIVSPDWDVLVTDMQGRPISGAKVSDISQQYTLESESTEEEATTGADGRAHFHMRTVYANGVRRLTGVMRNVGDTGVHASFGVHTYVVAFKSGYGDPMKLADFARNERESTANGRAHQSSHLQLVKCATGYGGIGCKFPDDPSKPALPFEP